MAHNNRGGIPGTLMRLLVALQLIFGAIGVAGAIGFYYATGEVNLTILTTAAVNFTMAAALAAALHGLKWM